MVSSVMMYFIHADDDNDDDHRRHDIQLVDEIFVGRSLEHDDEMLLQKKYTSKP
jgi:hypothetical protein